MNDFLHDYEFAKKEVEGYFQSLGLLSDFGNNIEKESLEDCLKKLIKAVQDGRLSVDIQDSTLKFTPKYSKKVDREFVFHEPDGNMITAAGARMQNNPIDGMFWLLSQMAKTSVSNLKSVGTADYAVLQAMATVFFTGA